MNGAKTSSGKMRPSMCVFLSIILFLSRRHLSINKQFTPTKMASPRGPRKTVPQTAFPLLFFLVIELASNRKVINANTEKCAICLFFTFPGYTQECVVCGVEVPHCDGKAGLAAITLKPGQELDGKGLRDFLNLHMPVYTHPIFFRVRKKMDLTATYKYRKVWQCTCVPPACLQSACVMWKGWMCCWLQNRFSGQINWGIWTPTRSMQCMWTHTVKSEISVRYRFSYFWLQTGSCELIFVLSRASKQGDVEKLEKLEKLECLTSSTSSLSSMQPLPGFNHSFIDFAENIMNLNQIFSFFSDENRRTDSWIRRIKKAQRILAGDRTRVLRMLVARSNHWASSDPAVSSSIFLRPEKEERIWLGMILARASFRSRISFSCPIVMKLSLKWLDFSMIAVHSVV